jgi:hypothetical protein
MLKNLTVSSILLVSCLALNVAALPTVCAKTDNAQTSNVPFGNDEQEFIFAGRCTNGNAYRIHSYQMDVDGLSQAFYDYEGPAGKGTVRSNAVPKKMAIRVCNELADIADGSKYD